eukprot:TRINITY_DN21052_c0_g1_i1.p1 TRINITY_DN21052_c0_g1~~TRINITY_DN21052_c0_g1_i1.p1  ORF type:complete len:871 (+),score=141.17 TRINITY_DN21052_c0_g1_i1:42-2615(+)
MAAAATSPPSPRTLYFRLDEGDEELPETIAEGFGEEALQAHAQHHHLLNKSTSALLKKLDRLPLDNKIPKPTHQKAKAEKGLRDGRHIRNACRAQFVAAWAAGAALEFPSGNSDADTKSRAAGEELHDASTEIAMHESCLEGDSTPTTAATSVPCEAHLQEEDRAADEDTSENALPCRPRKAIFMVAEEASWSGKRAAADSRTERHVTSPLGQEALDSEQKQLVDRQCKAPSFANAVAAAVAAAAAGQVSDESHPERSMLQQLHNGSASHTQQGTATSLGRHRHPDASAVSGYHTPCEVSDASRLISSCAEIVSSPGIAAPSGNSTPRELATTFSRHKATQGIETPSQCVTPAPVPSGYCTPCGGVGSGFCSPRVAQNTSGFCTPRGLEDVQASGHVIQTNYRHHVPEPLTSSPVGTRPTSPEWTLGAAHSPRVSARTSTMSPRTAGLLSGSPADGSLLARRGSREMMGTTAVQNGFTAAEEGAWCGWELQTTPDGRLFYHHPASAISQWAAPPELRQVLGEWVEVSGSEGTYWHNECLGISCWSDPQNCSIHEAALDGNLFFIQLYAFANGDHDALDRKGRSALHSACAAGQAEAALLLMQGKASVDLGDQGGSTPLHWACRYGHTTVVRLLIEANASTDCANLLGDTPMHEAAALGQVDPLHWLVLAGADPHRRNCESRTPAQVAAARGWREAEVLLQLHEAHPCWGKGLDDCPKDLSENCSPDRLCLPGVMQNRSVLHENVGQKDADSAPVSPALKVVRAARPVLLGVQWLANRVLGERQVDLGRGNDFSFDQGAGQWVLNRPDAGSDDEASALSESEDEEPWQPQERPKSPRLPQAFRLWKSPEDEIDDSIKV